MDVSSRVLNDHLGHSNANPEEFLTASYQEATKSSLDLWKAAACGSMTGVDNAIQKGGKVNFIYNPDDRKMPLHVACEGGHLHVVKLLVENGAVVDAVAITNQDTPLILAVSSGNVDIVKFLVQNSASLDTKNCYGNTALLQAAKDGYYEICDELLNAGADISVVNNKGSSALHLCCYGENKKEHKIDLVRLLTKSGASVNARDERGVTPLLIAAGAARSDVIEFLLDNGADPSVKDNTGMDAHETAQFHDVQLSKKVMDVLSASSSQSRK